MSFEKKRILLKAFLGLQFGYFPVTWTFFSRKANSKISLVHERSSRTIFSPLKNY